MNLSTEGMTHVHARAVEHLTDPLQMPLSPRCWGDHPACGPGDKT